MSYLDGVRLHYTVLRAMRIHHPELLAAQGVYTGKTRKRVLMRSVLLCGTRYGAGTIVNGRSIREIFADHEKWQDNRLDRAIEKLDRQLLEAGLEP